jgi:hypothetical protein
MATIAAPAGHPSTSIALIAAQFGGLEITVKPTDGQRKVRPDTGSPCLPVAMPTPSAGCALQEPVLTTADGDAIQQSDAIARYGA